jgi:hypothetical protein
VPTEDIINQVSFKFTCLGGAKIYKKQMQAMETETLMMLLFVSNGTEHSSISADLKQLLELAYNDIDTEGIEKIRPWARGLRVMQMKTIGRGRGGHPWWAQPLFVMIK